MQPQLTAPWLAVVRPIPMSLLVLLIAAASLDGCRGFSVVPQQPTRRLAAKFLMQAKKGGRALPFQTTAETTEFRFESSSRSVPEATKQQPGRQQKQPQESEFRLPNGQQQQQQQQPRRRFVSSMASAAIGVLWASESSLSAAAEETALLPPPSKPGRIVRLSSGLQFSDAKVGAGSLVKITKPPVPNANDDDDDENDDDPNVVLMHLKAIRRDGSTLLDTREEGRPVLFRLGSIKAEELYYINESSALSKGRIPLGVQDAILAQGAASWEGGYGKANPMRYGGLRMVVVPPALAYGSRGVSRYEAYKLGLKSPVARDEILRYEIELFRCNDDAIELAEQGGKEESGAADNNNNSKKPSSAAPRARACCLDEFYPCQTAPPPSPGAETR